MKRTVQQVDPLLPPEAVMRELGISRDRYNRMCARGELQAVHVGRTWKVRRSTLMHYLQTHTRQSEPHIDRVYYEVNSGQVLVLDQYGLTMPQFMGKRQDVEERIQEVYSGSWVAINWPIGDSWVLDPHANNHIQNGQREQS